jgi:hypothetical protein
MVKVKPDPESKREPYTVWKSLREFVVLHRSLDALATSKGLTALRFGPNENYTNKPSDPETTRASLDEFLTLCLSKQIFWEELAVFTGLKQRDGLQPSTLFDRAKPRYDKLAKVAVTRPSIAGLASAPLSRSESGNRVLTSSGISINSGSRHELNELAWPFRSVFVTGWSLWETSKSSSEADFVTFQMTVVPVIRPLL